MSVAKTVMERLIEEKPSLRSSEEKAADYIIAHAREVVNLPITELAARIGVSEATIVRMCKKAGYRVFRS